MKIIAINEVIHDRDVLFWVIIVLNVYSNGSIKTV